ncbi:hypothetical protein C8R47DRAFT_300553 [Mycena vitilis]|nr:hypothetical protein C8R47DRAFT_300553 [Mycena vitilis]
MRFLFTGLPLLSVFIATVSAQNTITDQGGLCGPDDFFLAAFRDKDCQCQDATFIRTEGGTACAHVAPPNSFATCTTASGGRSSQCGYTCKPGFPDNGQGGCTQSSTGTGTGTGTGTNTTNPVALAPACTPPRTISYSSANAACGCESSMNRANARVRPEVATQCMPPPAHGRAACRNVAPGSRCTVDCDPPFIASADETTCIAVRQNTTMSEFDCSSDAGSIQYLSADPNGGCICKDEDDGTCSVSASNRDPDAEMICSDTTDMGGNRDVSCAVRCTDTFVATDPTTCGPREVEGDSVTMAGTATPNSASEVACTNRVYKLPGIGGCKCDTTTPTGATECTAGQNAYPICAYERGSGEEADCGFACVPGKNLFNGRCR